MEEASCWGAGMASNKAAAACHLGDGTQQEVPFSCVDAVRAEVGEWDEQIVLLLPDVAVDRHGSSQESFQMRRDNSDF